MRCRVLCTKPGQRVRGTGLGWEGSGDGAPPPVGVWQWHSLEGGGGVEHTLQGCGFLRQPGHKARVLAVVAEGSSAPPPPQCSLAAPPTSGSPQCSPTRAQLVIPPSATTPNILSAAGHAHLEHGQVGVPPEHLGHKVAEGSLEVGLAGGERGAPAFLRARVRACAGVCQWAVACHWLPLAGRVDALCR